MTDTLETYAAFLETIPDSGLLVDGDGRIVAANRRSHQLFGHRPSELIGELVEVLVPEAQRATHSVWRQGFLAEPRVRKMGSALSLSAQCKNGRTVPVDIMLSPVVLDGQHYTVCVVRDMAQARRHEAALQQALELERRHAHTDYLTGAANSRHLHDAIDHELRLLGRYGHPFSVAYIDLDNFKEINDAFGHGVGDQVLLTVAQSIRQLLRDTDCVARLGGDEFAVLLVQSDASAAEGVISRIVRRLSVVMARHDWPVTFSVGVMSYTVGAISADEVVRMADDLMYAVKREGKSGVRWGVFTDRERASMGEPRATMRSE